MSSVELEDLKQFITATVSQSEERIKSELREEMSTGFAKADLKTETLRQEVLGGFAGIAEAIDDIYEILDSHDRRLSRIEKKLLLNPA